MTNIRYRVAVKEKHIFFPGFLFFSIILFNWTILVSNEQNSSRLMTFCNCD